MPLTNSDIESKITFETDSSGAITELPFRILFLGNWSGKQNNFSLVNSPPIEIDRDNFDDVLSRLDVGLELDLYNNGSDLLSIHFSAIDDFHPDPLFQQVPLFDDLRDLRRRLVDPKTFDQAALEIRSRSADTFEEPRDDEPQNILAFDRHNESTNLLDEILSQQGKPSAIKDLGDHKKSSLDNLLAGLLSPHLVKIDEDEQSSLLQAVDNAISDLMRLILHHAQFQRLEAAWRGLRLLIRRTETGADLKIFILDVTKKQLVADLKSSDDLADSVIFGTLVIDNDAYSRKEPWAGVFGDYTFDLNIDDSATLMRLAKISSMADAPFISCIDSHVFGIESGDTRAEDFSLESAENKLWTTLRSLPESSYLGFVIPHFLTRLPYGSDTDPIESFSFEEFIKNPDRTMYPWANPSFICALLLNKSYRLRGWNIARLAVYEVEDLPVHIYSMGGDSFVQYGVEMSMNTKICDKFLDLGLMPLLCDTTGLRLSRWQSISKSAKELSGRWKK